MLRAKIAVLVSGGGTNLQALLDAEKSGIITSGKINLVISSTPDAYALERAKAAGVQTQVAVRRGRTQEEFENELLSYLHEAQIDLIVLAGFMCILSKRFTDEFPERIINVHPALIPSFCGEGFYGLHVHEAALSYGVKVTGATVHFVNEIPDGGRIIAQKAVEVLDTDTPETLQQRVMREAEWIILPRATEIISKEITEARQHGHI